MNNELSLALPHKARILSAFLLDTANRFMYVVGLSVCVCVCVCVRARTCVRTCDLHTVLTSGYYVLSEFAKLCIYYA